ncbi:hypothetical protein AVEN_260661-1 [Araneus ventricosus]|uniref:Uncharacterized protein n=1 Tax=Araneus ventricosus TaxID=182803 RepID=A0A4Y2JH61_ARAVE|nr:hypothetical protein AVEN_260661-1 [Araneus ventricosus]
MEEHNSEKSRPGQPNPEKPQSGNGGSAQNFEKKQEELLARMLKRPVLQPYHSLPRPSLRKKPSESHLVLKEGTEPMLGFSELQKFKMVNETRTITPYYPVETTEELIEKPETTTVPELKIPINDPKRFLLEKLGRISVSHLESLVNLVHDHPDLGYVGMNREHMDLVNDYDPYSFTICSYNSINKDNYATVSSNGILEFYKGDADFLPLDRLDVEQKLFIALKEIPSFVTFRLWKAFVVWLKKNRMKRFIEARDKLEMFFATKYSQKAKAQS